MSSAAFPSGYRYSTLRIHGTVALTDSTWSSCTMRNIKAAHTHQRSSRRAFCSFDATSRFSSRHFSLSTLSTAAGLSAHPKWEDGKLTFCHNRAGRLRGINSMVGVRVCTGCRASFAWRFHHSNTVLVGRTVGKIDYTHSANEMNRDDR
jgi:hypothetical protein